VSGYGFGLIATEDPRYGRVVSHSGGLPGFGSHVEWLPDHGVGIVGFANLTYAPVREAVGEAIEALAATGGLIPRMIPPAEALVTAHEAVLQLYRAWDAGIAESIAADNLFLDRPVEQRQLEFDQLRTTHGPCVEPGTLRTSGALRATWRMVCARGAIDVEVWLSPTTPARVQVLTLTPVISPSEASGDGGEGLGK